MFRCTCIKFSKLDDAETKKELIIITAARNGYINILREIPNLNTEQNSIIYKTAARHGNIDILKQESTLRFLCPDISTFAVEGGHLHIIEWLISMGYEIQKDDCLVAAKMGHFEVLKYLIDNKITPLHKETCDYAALGGTQSHFEILKWLEDKCHVDGKTIINATRSGNLEMIKYLHQKTEYYLEWLWIDNVAITQGHLNVLIWLQSIGIEITEYAADYLHSETCTVEMLEWLKWYSNNGIIFDAKLLNEITEKWHRDDIIDWIESNGFLLQNTEYMKMRRILEENGYTQPYRIFTLERIKILATNGYNITERLVTMFADEGKFQIVKWLLTNNFSYNKEIRKRTEFFGHIQMHRWLIENWY